MLLLAAGLALLVWLAVLALPAQPHRTRERLEPAAAGWPDLSDVAVLIPARNESRHIGATLKALAHQGPGLSVTVIDDESSDSTAAVCRAFEPPPAAGPNGEHASMKVAVVAGEPLPPGWGGKLWALEQGLRAVERPWVLLLDADIELERGVVAGLKGRAAERDADLVSIMATLCAETFWERLFAPAFVYFFKLLYPFARVNDAASRVAAAAGGCVLVRAALLRELGAFASIKDALIDDCTLARLAKDRGARLWLGMSHAVQSRRRYGLKSFWRMVSRTAFTQLAYSPLLLALTLLALGVVFIAPPAAVLLGGTVAHAALGAAACAAMLATFVPVVRFYGLPLSWALALPVAAVGFGAMTLASAANYWRGTRAEWKDRTYES